MRVTILAIGRARAGPEATLVEDYLDRFTRTGRALGLGPGRLVEIEDRKGGGARVEAGLLRAAHPVGAVPWLLDERGDTMDSPGFAAALAALRDGGARDLCVSIGGADGVDPAYRAAAARCVALGPMVWPHLLVRVMIAEQLYRAATILAGLPYHRV